MWSLVYKNTEETMCAYSIANYPAEGDIVKLNICISTPPSDLKGNLQKAKSIISSIYLFSLKPREKVYLTGFFESIHPDLISNKEMIFIY